MGEARVFQPAHLLPESWRSFAHPGPVRLFNPGLLADEAGWILAYRVVGPDLLRRIGICRLDPQFRVVGGSAVALTDLVRFSDRSPYSERARTWFADPRLVRLAGRVFVYWNSGWHDPQNHQFLHEIDPATLRPTGLPRELILRGERRKLEKNWAFFGDGPFYAVYSVAPHHVLQFSVEGDGDIEFSTAAVTEWEDRGYSAQFGELRGGAPPQLWDGHYYSFCHSVHHAPEGYRYAPAVYRFSATFPFSPTDAPAAPVALANPFGSCTVHDRLNPVVGEVVYPCGAAHQPGRWIVSYGINDEQCAIAILDEAEIANLLRPAGPAAG